MQIVLSLHLLPVAVAYIFQGKSRNALEQGLPHSWEVAEMGHLPGFLSLP